MTEVQNNKHHKKNICKKKKGFDKQTMQEIVHDTANGGCTNAQLCNNMTMKNECQSSVI